MWIAVSATCILCGLLALWCIYGFRDYGVALFLITPLLIGTCSTIIYGYNREIKRSQGYKVSFITLGICTFALLVFAIEGIICIVMSMPIALLLTWLGSIAGHVILTRGSGSSTVTIIILTALVPSVAFIEKDIELSLTSVTTSIEIDASPEAVWKNVIEFPQLEEPDELLFKAGIAYPIDAKIEGTGVGAIRHCNFTTGSFVEPITVWDEPRLLKFSVDEQPAPMKELSFWDIDAPHLHDYFVSKQGQFKLTKLPNGNTLLEGTTWYYHNIKPAVYWRLWSDYIIHKIHNRVLQHIKKNSEI